MTEEQIKIYKMLSSDIELSKRKLALKLQLEELDSQADVQGVNYENCGTANQHCGNKTENRIIEHMNSRDYILQELNDVQKLIDTSLFMKRSLFRAIESSEDYCIATMLFISHLSHSEIAEILGCDTKTVQRKKLHIINSVMSFNVHH